MLLIRKAAIIFCLNLNSSPIVLAGQLQLAICILVPSKDLYQALETLKKLCEFSAVSADWADLGSTEMAKQKLQTDSNFPSKGQVFI